MALLTDRNNVHTARHDPLGTGIDEVLDGLPPEYVIGGRGDARLVVGPSGAFILMAAHDDTEQMASLLHQLTAATRNALCDHLTLVPFLDSIAVTSGEPPRTTSVPVAPLDLLSDMLTQGPAVIDATTLCSIRETVRTGKLDGWNVGTGAAGDKIDLCDPTPQTTTRG